MVTREIKGEYVRDKFKCLEEVLCGLLCQYQHKMINKPFHIYICGNTKEAQTFQQIYHHHVSFLEA